VIKVAEVRRFIIEAVLLSDGETQEDDEESDEESDPARQRAKKTSSKANAIAPKCYNILIYFGGTANNFGSTDPDPLDLGLFDAGNQTICDDLQDDRQTNIVTYQHIGLTGVDSGLIIQALVKNLYRR
jgi:hypothetical protein